MRRQILESEISVCQLCEFIAARHSIRPRTLHRISAYKDRWRNFTTTRVLLTRKSGTFSTRAAEPFSTRCNAAKTAAIPRGRNYSTIDSDLRNVKDFYKTLSTTSVPSEDAIHTILERCKVTADSLVDPGGQSLSDKEGSAASALLSIDEPAATKAAQKAHKFSGATQKYVDELSSTVYSILVHPTVFITPNLLERYVDLQSRLRKPKTFPEVFQLYASKPIPEKGSSPVKFIKQNPNKASNSVKSAVADRALQTAINTKQLVVAMDIVETTYGTKAFRRDKFVRKALLPVTGLAAAPVAAYAVASQLSTYQTTMDPSMATNVAFAGILAYVGFTTTIGVVAVTTANDQMDRVTWAQGMPLRERWIREEERAAIDKIAGAWGFRQNWRRGEEEGEEWDALKEWIGRKGMMLDRVELMEGME